MTSPGDTAERWWLVKRPDYQTWHVWDLCPPPQLGLEVMEVVKAKKLKKRIMKKHLGKLFAASLLALALLSLAIPGIGCKSTLETGGAYAQTNTLPDLQFYQIDAAYDFAYSTIDAAFKFEKDNRQTLWKISPEIKHSLDKIRPQAVLADREYLAARAAYMANPTPAGLSVLQTALSKAQQLTAAAQAAVAVKGN